MKGLALMHMWDGNGDKGLKRQLGMHPGSQCLPQQQQHRMAARGAKSRIQRLLLDLDITESGGVEAAVAAAAGSSDVDDLLQVLQASGRAVGEAGDLDSELDSASVSTEDNMDQVLAAMAVQGTDTTPQQHAWRQQTTNPLCAGSWPTQS